MQCLLQTACLYTLQENVGVWQITNWNNIWHESTVDLYLLLLSVPSFVITSHASSHVKQTSFIIVKSDQWLYSCCCSSMHVSVVISPGSRMLCFLKWQNSMFYTNGQICVVSEKETHIYHVYGDKSAIHLLLQIFMYSGYVVSIQVLQDVLSQNK